MLGTTRKLWTAATAALAVLGVVGGCQPPGGAGAKADAAKAATPAKVENATKEADLATVTLTPEAETHLGLVVTAVERKPVARTATYGGEVVIPPGRLINVTSPFVALVKPPPGAALPTPGTAVKEGQPVFLLMPILSPEARATLEPQLIDAQGQVKQAKDQLQIAKTAYERAAKLVADKLGGSAALVDAKANYDLAQTTMKAAEARVETLTKVGADAKNGTMSAQTVESPASGVIQNVHAQAGQKVAAGAALFEVAGLDPVWVKVPVYVGDLDRLATDQPAGVGGLADAPGAPGERPGTPVAAPPSADPLAATANVFYEVSNKDGAMRPGQRVGVNLPLKGDVDGLTVPRAAVMRDSHGGTWVYEQIAPHKYARRRVLVDRVVGDLAVLTNGPKPGAKVVSTGAVELYGTEFK